MARGDPLGKPAPDPRDTNRAALDVQPRRSEPRARQGHRRSAAAGIAQQSDFGAAGGRRFKETETAAVSRYTTRAVLADEARVMRDAAAMAGDTRHGLTAAEGEAALDRHPQVTGERRDVFWELTDAKGVAVLAGEAGTGKSTTLAAVRDAYEAAGYQVIGHELDQPGGAKPKAGRLPRRDDGRRRALSPRSQFHPLGQPHSADRR